MEVRSLLPEQVLQVWLSTSLTVFSYSRVGNENLEKGGAMREKETGPLNDCLMPTKLYRIK